MKLQETLKNSINLLEEAGIGTARLDTLVLMEDTLGKDRSYLLAHPEMEISDKLNTKITQSLERRIKHEPVAYILGHTEFYGREFIVDKQVLVPRPETETMIDLLKNLTVKTPLVADVGSGCGAIGITAALELPGTLADFYDIGPGTLKVAEKNIQKYSLKAKCYKSDLLEQSTAAYDVILANLPYVPDSHTINQAAMTEPKIAIFGGEDGLDLYRRLFKQIGNLKNKPAYIFTESLPFQHKKLATIAKKAGYHLHKTDDFIQVFTA